MKSRALLSENVVGQVCAALDAHRGRPEPATLGFIAGQLRSLDRDADAEGTEDLLMTRLGARDMVHLIFTLSGNDPTAPLAAHAAGRKLITDRRLIGLRVSDHQAFIQAVFDHIHARGSRVPQSPEEIAARLDGATRPRARENLVRRGSARGMIWRDGNLPAGAPPFAASLTEDLFYHGYGVLAQALRLRELGGARADVEHALRVAAESRVTIQRSLA